MRRLTYCLRQCVGGRDVLILHVRLGFALWILLPRVIHRGAACTVGVVCGVGAQVTGEGDVIYASVPSRSSE
jgi:hypothetical protein